MLFVFFVDKQIWGIFSAICKSYAHAPNSNVDDSDDGDGGDDYSEQRQ